MTIRIKSLLLADELLLRQADLTQSPAPTLWKFHMTIRNGSLTVEIPSSNDDFRVRYISLPEGMIGGDLLLKKFIPLLISCVCLS